MPLLCQLSATFILFARPCFSQSLLTGLLFICIQLGVGATNACTHKKWYDDTRAWRWGSPTDFHKLRTQTSYLLSVQDHEVVPVVCQGLELCRNLIFCKPQQQARRSGVPHPLDARLGVRDRDTRAKKEQHGWKDTP